MEKRLRTTKKGAETAPRAPPTLASCDYYLARIAHGPVAAFARTRDVLAGYARVLANAATTVCPALSGIVRNPG